MKKNILITGASGFIGSFLVNEAISRGYQTFAGVRNESIRKYLTDPTIHFIEMNYLNEKALDKSLLDTAEKFGRFDYIIHTAGVTKTLNNDDFEKVNFENTQRFVHSLQRTNLVPNKFIYISSLASYGPSENGSPIKSSKTPSPLTPYGKSKLKTEQFLYTVTDFPFLIMNPTAVYGPRDKDFFVLLKSINNHVELYIGNDQQKLSFVHVSDLVDAIFLAMESEAEGQNLLVSDLNTYTSKQVNQLIKLHLNKKTIALVISPLVAAIAASILERLGKIQGKVPVLNIERLKEFKAPNWSADCTELAALGFQPKYDLDKGLKDAIRWYREHGWMK